MHSLRKTWSNQVETPRGNNNEDNTLDEEIFCSSALLLDYAKASSYPTYNINVNNKNKTKRLNKMTK